jgi:hypothetical protein
MRVTTALGRAVVVAVSTIVALTLLAGIVGALLRFTFHGLVGGHGAESYGADMFGGVGFVFGFGIGLETVLVWAAILVVPVGVAYLAYYAVRGEPSETRRRAAN